MECLYAIQSCPLRHLVPAIPGHGCRARGRCLRSRCQDPGHRPAARRLRRHARPRPRRHPARAGVAAGRPDQARREPAAKDRGRRRAGDPEGARGPGDRHLPGRRQHGTGSAHRPRSARRPPEAPSAHPAPPQVDRRTQAPSRALVALSDPEPVRGYATVGVTWKHGVAVRRGPDRASRSGPRRTAPGRAGWTRRTTTTTARTAARRGGARASERPGTDALVIGDVDRVQMRAETTDGTAPPGPQARRHRPGHRDDDQAGPGDRHREAPPADTEPTPTSRWPRNAPAQASGPGHGRAQRHEESRRSPTIYSRAQWGANERLRDQSAPSYGTVKAGSSTTR